MTIATDYPLNWYSRTASDKSGNGPAYLWFLNHADRATVSGGTVFSDVSTNDMTVFERGSAILQSTVQSKFGGSSLLLSGSTASVDKAYLAWNVPFFSAGTATPATPAFQIETQIYFASLLTSNMYWFEFTNISHGSYFQSYFWNDAGTWKLHLDMFSTGLGNFLNKDWVVADMSTGTFHHFAVVRVDTQLVGNGWITCFQNGSQLVKVAGGTPTSGAGNWSGLAFGIPATDYLSWGGLIYPTGSTLPIPGYMDEMRILYDSLEGVTSTTMDVPTGPFTPVSGSFNVSAKTLSLTSLAFLCTTNMGLTLGTLTSRWSDFYVGSTAHIYMGTGTAVGIYTTGSHAMVLAAPSFLDVQCNIRMVGKNIESDSATGIRIGTTTNTRLSFYGASPLGRPTSTTDLKDLIVQLGFQADGDPTDLNIDGGAFITSGSSTLGQLLISDGNNLLFGTATGTKIGTTTNTKLSFYGATPVVRQTALTAQLTTITFTNPTTPDYAIQDLVNVGPYGFVSADEGQSLLSVVANLQARVAQLETKLQAYGLLA